MTIDNYDQWLEAFQSIEEDNPETNEMLFTVLSYDETCDCSDTGSGSKVGRAESWSISTSGDDGGWWHDEGTDQQFAVTDAGAIHPCRFGYHKTLGTVPGTTYNTFFRFQSVTIPRGATINYAEIRVYNEVSTSDAYVAKVWIRGQDVGDGVAPTNYSEAANQNLTSNCKLWTISDFWATDSAKYTPNINCVIQEIVNRLDWSSGNDMVINLLGKDNTDISAVNPLYRQAYDYSSDSSKRAYLFVWYTFDETGSGGVVVGGNGHDMAIWNNTGGGGGQLGGVATAYTIYQPVITGGVEAAGDAYVRAGLFGSGGVVAGGNAFDSGIWHHGTSGGVEIGGESPNRSGIFGSGGFELGSSAVDRATFSTIAVGGVVVSGVVVHQQVNNYIPGQLYPNGFRYRRLVTIPEDSFSSQQFEFPILARLELDSSSPVRCESLTGEVLQSEIESWVDGDLVLWVKVPVIDDNEYTFWLYYSYGGGL